MKMSVGDITFNNYIPDGNGTLWIKAKLEGWNSVALRQEFAPVTSRHGVIQTKSEFGEKALILTGTATAVDNANMWAAINLITGLVHDLINPMQVVVYEPTPKQVWAVLGGEFIVEEYTTDFDFELHMIAPNPFKTALDRQYVTIAAGATETLTNNGNRSAAVNIAADTVGTLAIRNQDSNEVLSTGPHPVPINTSANFDLRTLYSGGSDLYGFLSSPPGWWELAPGDTAIINQGSANVTVSFRDTWA